MASGHIIVCLKEWLSLFPGYVKALLASGHAIEFFIEGGRARDGHINKAKLGLLSYVVDAFLDGHLPKARLLTICNPLL